jgi:translation initiation factor IF-3
MTTHPSGPSRRLDRGPSAAHRINHRIRAPQIRVWLDDQQLGVMTTPDALRLAHEHGLDLVEITPLATPPVCRIVDYGRFKYDQAKQRSRPRVVDTKEMVFRPKTDDHDLAFKVRHIRRFLEEGHRVRLVIVFRGRELAHPHTGKLVIDRVIERSADLAHLEADARLEGRRMIALIAPKRRRG